jgi:hypothetical protein
MNIKPAFLPRAIPPFIGSRLRAAAFTAITAGVRLMTAAKATNQKKKFLINQVAEPDGTMD